MPVVSVIIPTYNRAKLVTKAIDSVLAQTYTDYEIIVIDDGSTDNTKEVLEPYMHKIKYIYQDNAGVYVARNLGIRQAKGQWIAFLDSDDQWLPEKLACQLECVYRTGTKVCFTNSKIFNGKKLIERYPSKIKKPIAQEEIITDPFALFAIEGPPHTLPTMLVAKNLLEEVGLFNEKLRIGDDTRLIFDLALRTPFVFIPSVLAEINSSENRNGLVNNSITAMRERSQIQISILSEAYFHERKKSKAAYTSIRRRLAHALFTRAKIACIDKEYDYARRLASDSMHFANDSAAYLRSLVIWLCPQLAAKIVRLHWKE